MTKINLLNKKNIVDLRPKKVSVTMSTCAYDLRGNIIDEDTITEWEVVKDLKIKLIPGKEKGKCKTIKVKIEFKTIIWR